jgi:hypothetical protein
VCAAATCGTCADGTAAVAARVAGAESKLPWFWSPSAEGLADIPYTYKSIVTLRLTRGGKEVPRAPGDSSPANWRELQLERIPLDWGAFMRCLSADGISPCSDAWNQEFDRETKRRDALTAEERLKIDASREERRQRRRNFWDDFPGAMRFEAAEANELRFSPLPGYKPAHSVHNSMLTGVTGRLRFDPSTNEITQMEYDLVRDVEEPFLRLPKGSRFEISLTRSADGHYLPERILVRRHIAKSGEIEEKTTLTSDFRRFDSESKIQFGDPGK